MRLHSLSISAFGPFAGSEVVDFDALSESGIFLLHGPTGAGKTSILDAISFAIFGVVPGVRGQAGRLRSDHANPDQPTEIGLEVTVRGRRLRFTRRPGWDRPKRRGSGTTREQPRVLVEELACGDAPRVISTRLDEAGAFVRDVFGMTAEQFCQVVLLPQGRFADFLRADAESRRALLEQLFATSRFSAVETYLVEERRRRGRVLEDARVSLTALLARIAQVAKVDPMSAPSSGEDDLNVAGDWAARLLQAALTAADLAAAAESAAAARLVHARSAHDEATRLAEQQHRHAEALRRSAELQRESAHIDDLRRNLEAVRLVTTLQPLLTAEDLARAARTQTEHDEAAARTRLPADLRPAPVQVLGKEQQRLTGELAVLHALRDTELRAAELQTQVAALKGAIGNAQSASKAMRVEFDTLPDVLAAAEGDVREADKAALLIAGLQADSAAAAARAEAGRRRDALGRTLSEQTQRAVEATQLAQELREHWLDQRQARLEGMAAELAGDLRTGQPCGVCGSEAHPAPAAGGAHGPTAEQEQSAQTAATQAAAKRDAIAATLASVTAEHAAAAALAGDSPIADLAQRATELKSRAAQVAATAATAAACRAELQRLQTRATQLAVDLAALDVARAEATARCSQLTVELSDAHSRLADALDGDTTLALRIARLEQLGAALDQAIDAARSSSEARTRHDDALEHAETAVSAAGWTLAAVRAIDASPAALEEARGRIANVEAQQRAVADVLGDATLRAAAASPPAPLEATAEALTAAEAAATAATLVRGATTDAALALEQLNLELTSTLHALTPIHAAYVVADKLSQLAEGKGADNPLRMRLSAYVLAARLERVAAAANARLHDMSGGRYALAYTEEAMGGRGRAGLGLRILDAWTGRERDPATLSGGESFTASLALALGLADVATAEAGGVLLDTLLVDEGFGALDEDSLEEVMTVLDGLREGGRAVGLVSHVADLRARVPAQLVVRKGRAGSHLEPFGAAIPRGDAWVGGRRMKSSVTVPAAPARLASSSRKAVAGASANSPEDATTGADATYSVGTLFDVDTEHEGGVLFDVAAAGGGGATRSDSETARASSASGREVA